MPEARRPLAAIAPAGVQRALGALALLLLGACGPARLERAPLPATDLSGHWILVPAQSDDAAKLVAAAVPKPRPPPRPRDPSLDSSPGSGPGDDDARGGSRGGRGGRGQRGQRGQGGGGSGAATEEAPPSWGHTGPRDFVSAFVVPPGRLDIIQEPQAVRLGEADRRRTFEPGDEEPRSVTDRYGSRRVHAGWQRDEFSIISDDGARLSVSEHYRRRADDTLESRVEFSARGIKHVAVRAVYRRATPTELAAPTEGPPAPLAR